MIRKIKKNIFSIIAFILPAISLAQPVGSGGGSLPTGGGGGSLPTGGGNSRITSPFKEIGSIPQLLNKILEFVVELGAVIVVLFLVYAGFQFVIAQGNEEKLSKAKKTLFYTLIGAAILLGAEALSQLIAVTVSNF